MKYLLMIFGFLVFVSCAEKKNEYRSIADSDNMHQAKVKEVLMAEAYTYLRVEESGGEYWMAVGETDVEEGDVIFFNSYIVMNDFTSKELDRTFDQILFVDRISDKPISEKPKTIRSEGSSQQGTKYEKLLDSIKIEPAAGGMTIQQVYEKAESLDQKELVVRGQVIKINRDIMKRNWVHIMDGTKGLRSDLTFTTQEDFQIGDTVTVKGTIAVDKEYGAGYVYPVILEDAIRY